MLLVAGFMAIFGLRLARVSLLLALAFGWVCRTRFARAHRVLAGGWSPGQLRSEVRAGLLVLAFDAVLATMLWRAFGTPTAWLSGQGWAAGLATFAAFFFWFEVWFYGVHRLLHTRRFYRWHRQHHVAVVCSPLTAFSFSLVERASLAAGALLFVGAAATSGAGSGAGVLAYAAFNMVGNVLGHCNVEPWPRGRLATVVAGWLVTPTFHALHHARRRSHFGLFTTALDRVFGSVEPDWEAALVATSGGQALPGTHRVN